MEETIVSSDLQEVRKALKEKTVLFGTERVMKELKKGNILKVFLSDNAPDGIKADVDYYSKLSEFAILNLSIPNDELGVFCKKPFSISVMGVVKS
jgi:large subunit ribosomal protein L30e